MLLNLHLLSRSKCKKETTAEMLRSKWTYTSITLGLDSCFEAWANGCTQTKLGTHSALLACTCVQRREKERKLVVNIEVPWMLLAMPLLHRDLLHSLPEPLWKLRTEIMFTCSAGPMGERRAFSHKQIHSPHSVASKKKIWVKNHNWNKVNRTVPLQKGTYTCHFLYATAGAIWQLGGQLSCSFVLMRSCPSLCYQTLLYMGVRFTQWLSCKRSLS